MCQLTSLTSTSQRLLSLSNSNIKDVVVSKSVCSLIDTGSDVNRTVGNNINKLSIYFLYCLLEMLLAIISRSASNAVNGESVILYLVY